VDERVEPRGRGDLDRHGWRGEFGAARAAPGRLADAIDACRRSVTLAPDVAIGHRWLGRLLWESGLPADARNCLERAVALRPEDLTASQMLGFVCAELGEIVRAEAVYRAALELAPNDAVIRYELSRLKTFETRDDPDLQMLEELASSVSDPATPGRDALLFALAKAYDDLGDYDRAFEAFQAANALHRVGLDYDPATAERAADALIGAFDEALVERSSGLGCPSERPVFIVGMPRSGTTLVEQILASHPDVHGAGELHELEVVAGAVPVMNAGRLPLPEGMAGLGARDLAQLGELYDGRLGRLVPEALRITDKMPSNFYYIGFIHAILPNARIIHCVRDPLDTCLSCYMTLFSPGSSWSYDLREVGRYYRSYDRVMAHWRLVLPEARMFEVRYEDVVSDLEGQARRLLDHCGLEWDDACLAFHLTKRPVRTASVAQVRRPLYAGSVGRWRRYERHLGVLISEVG